MIILPSQEQLYQEWMLLNQKCTYGLINHDATKNQRTLIILNHNYDVVRTVKKYYTRGNKNPVADRAMLKFHAEADIEFGTEYLDIVQRIARSFKLHYCFKYLSRWHVKDEYGIPVRLEPGTFQEPTCSQVFTDFMYDVRNYRKGDMGKRLGERHAEFEKEGLVVEKPTAPESETIRIHRF